MRKNEREEVLENIGRRRLTSIVEMISITLLIFLRFLVNALISKFHKMLSFHVRRQILKIDYDKSNSRS